MAIGAWYRDFRQVDNGEVAAWLARAKDVADPRATARTSDERLVKIDVGGIQLVGNLALPVSPSGVVLFAHGSGSSRFSPRNRYVASVLQSAGLGTLLMDLCPPRKKSATSGPGSCASTSSCWRSGSCARSIGSRARRRRAGCASAALARAPARRRRWWRRRRGRTRSPRWYRAAAGRISPAGALPRVRAPTLLLVGGKDVDVLELNREALEQLSCEKELTIVRGATHLFEEPGTLARVANLAAEWFSRHLPMRENAATV